MREMSKIELYNTLTRKKEPFKPLHTDWVGLYTCGPTVYNYAHIGNLRTYIFEDILRRTLEYAGYKVRQVMNITDIEDKIIRDAAKAGQSIFEFVRPYEKAFLADIAKLNIKRAMKYPRATRHIPGMVELIQKLLQKGIAYEMNGSVYFSVTKFKPYGRLSRINAQQLKAGVRIDADEYAKENLQDFALWKVRKPGEPFWKTQFGEGHPGWHIECSVMSMKYLGETFDLHTGGVDNIFPHHENEIAQSEAATGKKFVHYWVHGEYLLVDGKKMAKSLGNFYTLRDIEAKEFDPLAYRYLILTSHYRSKLNFTWESLGAAERSLRRLREFVQALRKEKPRKNKQSIGQHVEKFQKAIFDDLDTPGALAVLWGIVHAYNKNPAVYDPRVIAKTIFDFDVVLGLELKKLKAEKISQEVLKLAELREKHRRNKAWEEADELRKKIELLGYSVKDTAEGPKVSRIS